MITRIENHPTDPEYLVAHTPPEIAHTMGRFGAANRSKKLNAYVIRAEHLEKFRTFLRIEAECTILDERDRPGQAKHTGPLPECGNPDCATPVSHTLAVTLKFCPTCAAPWAPANMAGEVTGVPGRGRKRCEMCQTMNGAGFTFCGECAAPLPGTLGAADIDVEKHVEAARAVAASRAVQEPLPIRTGIPEIPAHVRAEVAEVAARAQLPMTVDAEEETDREWYP